MNRIDKRREALTKFSDQLAAVMKDADILWHGATLPPDRAERANKRLSDLRNAMSALAAGDDLLTDAEHAGKVLRDSLERSNPTPPEEDEIIQRHGKHIGQLLTRHDDE